MLGHVIEVNWKEDSFWDNNGGYLVVAKYGNTVKVVSVVNPTERFMSIREIDLGKVDYKVMPHDSAIISSIVAEMTAYVKLDKDNKSRYIGVLDLIESLPEPAVEEMEVKRPEPSGLVVVNHIVSTNLTEFTFSERNALFLPFVQENRHIFHNIYHITANVQFRVKISPLYDRNDIIDWVLAETLPDKQLNEVSL